MFKRLGFTRFRIHGSFTSGENLEVSNANILEVWQNI